MPEIAKRAHHKAQFSLLEAAPFGPYVARPFVHPPLPPEPEPEQFEAALAKADHSDASGSTSADRSGPEGPPEPEDPADAPPIPAESLGRYVQLEGAGVAALGRFYSELRDLERTRHASGGKPATSATQATSDPPAPANAPAKKLRIAFYGSSQTSADFITHYLRVYLQERFGDGGHGFVALAKPWKYYRHIDVGVVTSRRWHTDHAQKSNRREDGYYGLMGVSTSAKRKRDHSTITLRNGAFASNFELFFLMQPRGGKFQFQVDGKTHATLATRSRRWGSGYHKFRLDSGLHEFSVRPRGDGEVRLFGIVAENDQPGVVLDTLGINGARAANHLLWDESMWAEQIRKRDPELFVLAYGANESMDVDQPIEEYEAQLREVLDRFAKALPDADCLMVGPGDFPRKGIDGIYRPRLRLREIVAVQRRVATQRNCAFWDTQAFMGGELGITQWVRAEPRMAGNDHLHLTRRGYVRLGMALTDALMAGHDRAPEHAMR